MFRSHLAAAALLLPGVALADPALDAEEIEFVRLINEYRAANGLGCLSVSPTATRAADYMSTAMGEERFFSHNEPPCDATTCSGRDPFERMRDFGHVGWSTAGENIAAGSRTAAQAFAGWKASPGHNENMLHPHFTAMGIARVEVEGSPWGVYWTNTFSNLVDGDHRCEEGLPEPGDGAGAGGGGTGGSGSPGGGGGGAGGAPLDCEPADGGEDDWGLGRPVERDPRCDGLAEDDGARRGRGGCATAPGLSLLGLLAAALRLRRR